MIAYIDHVSLAVGDAAQAAVELRENLSLGVAPVREDTPSGLVHAIVPLTRGYLELVAPLDGRRASSGIARRLNAFLESRQGLFSFALNSGDLRRDAATLRERGSSLGEPQRESRGEGDNARVWWSAFPTGEDLEPYVVQHDGVAAVDMSMAGARQPLSLRSIEEVVLIVPSIEESVRLYERDLGITVNRRSGRQVQLTAGASRIILVPANSASLGTPIGIYSVGVGTTDIKGAQAVLAERNIGCGTALFSWGVAVEIDPAYTCGARINLVQL